MASVFDTLLAQLNQTKLQKTDIQLYQVISLLIRASQNLETTVNAVVGGGGGGPSGFVTTSGGTPDTISMFTAPQNIEDVTALGVSNALDLLP